MRPASIALLSTLARADDPKVEPKAADADAPLAEGFPDATKPGAIVVKSYPAYRSALAKGEGMTTGSGDLLFWPLFNHISRRQVEMTAPVINTYKTPGMVESPEKRGNLTMEFVYPNRRLGEAGPGAGAVEVVDQPAAQFVCLGFQGGMDENEMRIGVERLRGWLGEHKGEWVEAGPPRRLGYHGPSTPAARRLWEVQIPIKPAAEAEPVPAQ